jgi:hypothetical protein
VSRLMGMRRRLDALFAREVRGTTTSAELRSGHGVFTLAFSTADSISVIDLREDITRGQRVARHTVEISNGGAWTMVAQGTTIGYKRLYRIPPTAARQVRVTVTEAFGEPDGLQLHAWLST